MCFFVSFFLRLPFCGYFLQFLQLADAFVHIVVRFAARQVLLNGWGRGHVQFRRHVLAIPCAMVRGRVEAGNAFLVNKQSETVRVETGAALNCEPVEGLILAFDWKGLFCRRLWALIVVLR